MNNVGNKIHDTMYTTRNKWCVYPEYTNSGILLTAVMREFIAASKFTPKLHHETYKPLKRKKNLK